MKQKLNSKFKLFIQNEPLFINDEKIKDFDLISVKDRDSSIFVGIGLVTSDHMTEDLPFDVLGMILPAERLRQNLGINKVIIQIADTHAISMGFSKDKITHAADVVESKLKKVVEKLKLNSFEVFKSSKFDPKPVDKEFLQKLRNHPNCTNDYIETEVRDMQFLKTNFNTKVKLSWIVPGVKNSGNDERLFDTIFDEISGGISFLHLQPGFTFDKKRWRVSPYIHESELARILLKPNENVNKKIKSAIEEWNDKAIGGAKNHLKEIVRCFESLFGNLRDMTLEEKIEFIIKKSMK